MASTGKHDIWEDQQRGSCEVIPDHVSLKAKYGPSAGQRANPKRTDMDNQLQGQSRKKQVSSQVVSEEQSVKEYGQGRQATTEKEQGKST